MEYLVLGCPRCLGTIARAVNRTPFPCPHCGEWCQLDQSFTTLLAFPTPPPMRRGDGARIPLRAADVVPYGKIIDAPLYPSPPTTPAAWIGLAVVAAIVGFIIGRLSC